MALDSRFLTPQPVHIVGFVLCGHVLEIGRTKWDLFISLIPKNCSAKNLQNRKWRKTWNYVARAIVAIRKVRWNLCRHPFSFFSSDESNFANVISFDFWSDWLCLSPPSSISLQDTGQSVCPCSPEVFYKLLVRHDLKICFQLNNKPEWFGLVRAQKDQMGRFLLLKNQIPSHPFICRRFLVFAET